MNPLRPVSPGVSHVSNSLLSIIALGLFAAGSARADVRLPALFTDHMVLQRGMEVPVWGWADDGEQVTVTFAGQAQTTRAQDGKWRVKLKPLKASDVSEKLTVKGKNEVTVEDVLVGEVWIASGQSNMEFQLKNSAGADDDIKVAGNTRLRLFTVAKSKQDAPVDDVKGSWLTDSPDAARQFSAVAYYFGKDLQAALKVPVGVIHTSWGGSPAEVWMSEDVLAANPDYKRDILGAYERQKANYEQALATYEQEKAAAEKAGETFSKRRPGLGWKPTELYNGMIAPLIPFSIKGAIWYQGESNAGRAYEYRSLMADLIKNWRRDWGLGDFTFLQVQLAPWDRNKRRSIGEITKEPGDSDWAELREAQVYVADSLPNAGYAVITDVGDTNDIHPTKKKPVGQRLALAAEAIAYGMKVEYAGPTFKSVKFSDGKAIVSFDHTGKGLAAGNNLTVVKIANFEADKPVSPNVPDGPLFSSFGGGIDIVFGNGQELTGFAIAGADKKFHWGTAKIVGRSVVVSSPDVPNPVTVRYGWADYPVVNLYNSAGLPASPFRTDDWPGVTWPK